MLYFIKELTIHYMSPCPQEWQEWIGKVESVAEWLADTSPVNLVLFKLEQPGQAIRQFGPGSLQAEQAVHKVSRQFRVHLQYASCYIGSERILYWLYMCV